MLDALTAGALEDAARRREAMPADRLESIAHAMPTPLDAAAILGLLRVLAKGENITQDVSTLENPAILEQLKESA